jgi:hypothetical protein
MRLIDASGHPWPQNPNKPPAYRSFGKGPRLCPRLLFHACCAFRMLQSTLARRLGKLKPCCERKRFHHSCLGNDVSSTD